MYYENTTKRYTDRMNVGVAEFVCSLASPLLYLHANYAQGRSKSHESYDIYIITITGLYILRNRKQVLVRINHY